MQISSYLDWQVNTGPQFLSGPENIINDVSRRSFILGKFLRGKPASEIMQGSDKIMETLYLNAKRTFQEFERGEDVTWQNPQKDKSMQLDFKFTLDHMSWDEWEYQQKTSNLYGAKLETKYKDMAFSKQQRLWESTVDGLEDLLWASPAGAAQFAAMENGGKSWYSIPVFINEGVGGATGSFDANWTTVENLSWTTYRTNWDNKRATYDAVDPGDISDNGTGLFNALDEIAMEVDYKTPGVKDRYFEDESAVGNQTLIATSKLGKLNMMDLNRKSNDSLIQKQDGAYPHPRWNGVPILDVQGLDSAALYLAQDSSTFVGENATGGTSAANTLKPGARYYVINT